VRSGHEGLLFASFSGIPSSTAVWTVGYWKVQFGRGEPRPAAAPDLPLFLLPPSVPTRPTPMTWRTRQADGSPLSTPSFLLATPQTIPAALPLYDKTISTQDPGRAFVWAAKSPPTASTRFWIIRGSRRPHSALGSPYICLSNEDRRPTTDDRPPPATGPNSAASYIVEIGDRSRTLAGRSLDTKLRRVPPY
jgi:hypothetical protein